VFKDHPNLQPDLEGNDYILERQLKPEARIDIPIILKNLDVKPTSMIDISDGLLSEAQHLSSASGVGIRLNSSQLQELPYFSDLQSEAESLGHDVWDWVLTGGEDHVFLATTSGVMPDGAYVIGEVISGKGVEVTGVSPRKNLGWTHFN
jgi:thiamine-monophosphate kinase